MMKRKFGWFPRKDERNKNYKIRTLLKGAVPRSYTWRCNVVLDQGSLGSCVGNGVAHELAARPVEQPNVDEKLAVKIYRLAQKLDEWAGESYEGSSVLGGMSAGKQLGYFKEYRWILNENDLAITIGNAGCVVIGVNWYTGMMEPDSKGIIKPTGSVEGGHCVLCNGLNIKTGLYRIHNSWSSDWGINGEAFISRTDMARLIKEDGEFSIAIGRKII